MESLRPSDPRQVGAYRLTARLGSGGMGQVFLGESPGHRKVAVKLVKPEHADDRQFRQRFAREVEAAKKVGGFHTAPVVDADPDGDPPWLVTAYIPGPSLLAAVKENGPLAPAAVQRLGAALAEGLAAIHAVGVIHRDLKPANVILADDGPRIIDFGIARAAESTSELTGTGIAIGTVSYMSPEQVQGQRVDARSDIFSLGSVLAFAACGRSPFEAETMPATAARIMGGPPRLDGVTGPLRQVLEGCLAKNPAERPSLTALTAALAGQAQTSTHTQVQQPYSERISVPVPPPVPYPSAGAGSTHAYTAAPQGGTALQPGPYPPATYPQAGPGPTQAPPPGQRRRGTGTALAVAGVVVAVAVGVGAYELTSGGTGSGASGTGTGTGAGTAGKAPATTAPATTAPAVPKAPPSLIPARFTGHWHGNLTNQTDGLQGKRAAAITVTKATADGKPAGTVSYTDGGGGLFAARACTFNSRLVSETATTVTLRETDTSGSCGNEYLVLTETTPGLRADVYNSNPASAGTGSTGSTGNTGNTGGFGSTGGTGFGGTGNSGNTGGGLFGSSAPSPSWSGHLARDNAS